MAKRKRDATARSRIRAYLAESGPVQDDRGGATTVLREAIAYQGSAVAFIQLITAMDEAGEITRDIRGKRTYGIAGVEQTASQAGGVSTAVKQRGESVPVSAPLDLDYDQLARALVRELARVIASAEREPAAAVDDGRGHASELVAERDRLQQERDDYAARLEASRRQLNALAALYVHEDEDAAHHADSDVVRQALSRLRDTEHQRGASVRAS